jgi:hydroxymethylpyrimidine/phosphomethylpyrimidine kinase
VRAVALTIAGSDPSGGAGIQADLKTFHRFGVYGEAAITLITVQNTQAVAEVHCLPSTLVADQIAAVVSDIPPSAAKTGALGSVQIVEAVAALAKTFSFPLVVDPVMLSKHGRSLLDPAAIEVFKRDLLPSAALLMPNLPEAEALTGIEVRDRSAMLDAARSLYDAGARAVLIKGGHLDGDPVDLLFDGRATEYKRRRIVTPHTHGTGCAYSAAITAALALRHSIRDAVPLARRFVQSAIRLAPRLGSGAGPLNYFARPGS